MSEISMPRLSDTMQEGTITRWLKKPGDKLKRGDIVAEVDTDKANMEIEFYENGVLEQILVKEGETASVGSTIALVKGGETASVGSTIALVKELETAQMDRSLSTPRHSDVSFTTFLDYLEGFYESFESAVEKYEQFYGKNPSGTRNYNNDEITIRAQYEGTYWGSDFFAAMGSLLRLLYVTMRKGPQPKHEAKPLEEWSCSVMFQSIAVHAGFFLTFFVNFTIDNPWMKDFTLFANSTRLIDLTQPLSEQDWDTLRSEAIRRIAALVQERNAENHAGTYHFSDFLKHYHGDRFGFHYLGHFAPRDTNKIVSEIITEEVFRFRRFIEALHCTLLYLANTVPLAQTNIKAPVFEWDKRGEALQAFKETLRLLRDIETGTVPNLQTNIIESELAHPATVTLQVRKDEHRGDMHTYHLTLTDSRHLSEPVRFLLQVSESGEAELFEDDNDILCKLCAKIPGA